MTPQIADSWLIHNAANFKAEQLDSIRQALYQADESKVSNLDALQLKSPMKSFILSSYLGSVGADRFYRGQTLLGVIKLITCGGATIWTIIDFFTAYGGTKDDNYEKLMAALA